MKIWIVKCSDPRVRWVYVYKPDEPIIGYEITEGHTQKYESCFTKRELNSGLKNLEIYSVSSKEINSKNLMQEINKIKLRLSL